MNYIYIVGISIILLFLFSIKGIKKSYNTITSKTYLSKSQTNWLRGIAIILIMYSHYYTSAGITYNSGIVSQVLGFGFIGVAIFLFLSGYAIMISKLNKPNYLKHFIFKRLIRLYVPFFISFVIFTIFMYLMGNSLTIQNIFGILIMSLPGTLNWYLKVQLGLYLVFYLIALFTKSNKKIILLTFIICLIYMIIGYICHIENYWYESCYLFPLGMAFALYKERIYNILNKKYLISLCCAVILSILLYIPYFIYGGVILEILFIIGIVMLLICICVRTSGNSKVVSYLGVISIDLYLSHTIILNSIRNNITYNENIFTFIGFMLVSIALAIIINKIGLLIINKIKQ